MTNILSQEQALELRAALAAARAAAAAGATPQQIGASFASRMMSFLTAIPHRIEAERELDSLVEYAMPLVTAYVTKTLPEEVVPEFAAFMATEGAQFAFGSVVAAWRSADTELPVTDAQVDEAYARFVAARNAVGR